MPCPVAFDLEDAAQIQAQPIAHGRAGFACGQRPQADREPGPATWHPGLPPPLAILPKTLRSGHWVSCPPHRRGAVRAPA